ncbi:hypothetical protein DT87_24190 [Streptomyces sp. NTK 937]|nr:hypothetical protein DT87_24190 [Streptomyces sp. NTK 937]
MGTSRDRPAAVQGVSGDAVRGPVSGTARRRPGFPAVRVRAAGRVFTGGAGAVTGPPARWPR